MSQYIQTIETAEAFESLVQQSEVPIVVDFWAPWCGPCKALGPILEDAAAALGEQAIVAKVNVDELPTLAQAHRITSIPSLLYFEGGQVHHRETGIATKEAIVARAKDLTATIA